MILSLAPFDYLILFIYLGTLFWLGLRKSTNDDDYLLAGRRLTVPLFVMTLVSTWYGGILGIGEFTFQYGISNWFIFGFPYYIFALIFALFIIPRLRKHTYTSLPDLITQRYGKTPGYLTAFLVSVLVTPAPYLFIAGLLFSLIFPGSSLLWAVTIFIISAFYLYKYGFKTVIQTDIIQFMFMFAGFAILMGVFLNKFSFTTDILPQLPETHIHLTGGLSWTYILSWFFIALWTLVDPGFHQRCLAAKDSRTARKGMLMSIGFWAVFDALTLMTALYGRALLPEADPLYLYPLLAEKFLPVGLLGIFYTGLIATVMSTLDSYLFISGQTLGYDLLAQWYPHGKPPRYYVRWGYAITGILSLILIWYIPSVVDLWYTIGTLIIPALILPVLFAYGNRTFSVRSIVISMAGAFLIPVVWYMISIITGEGYPFGIEPFYPGILWSILILFPAALKKPVENESERS
ncbi:MAG: Na+/solute symporter [Marinimicrobia bacterium 46_47]|nr:MAG: Na+/solute symporter [Marinimicrobia bacterium 46_47]KUK89604.1 MAG: Na+/proline symporter [Marinimicrobia bacterium 46_43]